MNQIPLNLLEALMVFSESKNMSVAADTLKISQAALSFKLKALQENLPYELFMTKGKKKILSAYGHEILKSFKEQLLSIPYCIEQVNNNYQSAQGISIKISGRMEILRRVMDNLSFEGHIQFIAQNSDPVVQDLLERKTDIAIAKTKPDSLMIHAKPLLRNRFCILIPAKWKISSRSTDEVIEKLKDRHYIEYNQKVSSRFAFMKNKKVHRSIEDWYQIIHSVQSGRGWSIVPDNFSFDEKQCSVIPLADSNILGEQFYLLYAKENIKFDWFKDIIDETIECFKR